MLRHACACINLNATTAVSYPGFKLISKLHDLEKVLPFTDSALYVDNGVSLYSQLARCVGHRCFPSQCDGRT